MFQDEAREALIKSTAVDGEKDPSSAVGDLFRGSLDLVGSTSRNTVGAGTVSVPACPAIISVSIVMLTARWSR